MGVDVGRGNATQVRVEAGHQKRQVVSQSRKVVSREEAGVYSTIASTRWRLLLESAPLAGWAAKYSRLPLGSAFMPLEPAFQLAGQTSPNSSVNWKAWTRRTVSSTLRPTGRSLTVIWRRTPLGSMMKRPRRATPWSSSRTPYLRLMAWFLSAIRGSFRSGPRPPCLRGC